MIYFLVLHFIFYFGAGFKSGSGCITFPVPLRQKVAVPGVPVPVPQHWMVTLSLRNYSLNISHLHVEPLPEADGVEHVIAAGQLRFLWFWFRNNRW